MNFQFDQYETEFIFSKDEVCFQRVLDLFDSAKLINVVTFSISTKENILMDSILQATKKGIPVKIIANIPGRFEQYFSERSKHISKKKINDYLAILNPEKYNYLLKTYFNFESHAKIIMTDKIAYVGSANFSDESNNNYEAGIISKDPAFIIYLLNKVIPELERSSLNYYGSIENNILLNSMFNLHSIEDYIQRVLSDISQTCFYITGKDYHTGKEFNDCKDSDKELRWRRVTGVVNALEFFSDHLSELENRCFNYDEDLHFFKQRYEQAINSICTKVSKICIEIERKSKYDEYGCTIALIEKMERNLIEPLDYGALVEIAQNISYHEKENHMYLLQEELILLMNTINEYLVTISWGKNQLGEFIAKYNELNPEIDNTKLSIL